MAIDDRTRNDAYKYSRSLSATDWGGLVACGFKALAVQDTKTNILAQSLNLFQTTLTPAI